MEAMNIKNMVAILGALALWQSFSSASHAEPLNTYCHMGGCSWEDILSEEVISAGDLESGYLVSKRSVRFSTAHEGDYPDKFDPSFERFRETLSETFIYCSLDRPAVFWDKSGKIETLHIISPYGYEYSAVNEYLYTCHRLAPYAPDNKQSTLLSLGYKKNDGEIFSNAQDLMQIRFESKISPSFDCNLAETEDEIAICDNNRLASLDLINAESYKMLKEVMGKEQAKEFARAALKERRKCKGDVQCIEQVLVWTDENYKRILGAE